MVYVVEVTLGGGYQQLGKYPEFEERVSREEHRISVDAWKHGDHQLKPEQVPKKLILFKPRKNLRDAFRSLNGISVVSDAMREVIETLDPGLHQFFPIQVEFPRGKLPEKKYNVIIISTKKKTIIPELSEVDGPRYGKFYSVVEYRKDVSFAPVCRDGAHMWREEGFRNEHFISDELAAAIKAKELKYLKHWPGKIVSTEEK